MRGLSWFWGWLGGNIERYIIPLVNNGILGAVPVVDLAKDPHTLIKDALDIIRVQNVVGLLHMGGYLHAWG